MGHVVSCRAGAGVGIGPSGRRADYAGRGAPGLFCWIHL